MVSLREPLITTSADISRNFGRWQDLAIHAPVVVTYHGRPRVALVSAEQFGLWNAEAEGSLVAGQDAALHAILENLSEGFVALDHDLRITAVNAVAVRYYGLSADKLVGAYLLGVFPALEASLVFDRIQRVLHTGIDDQVEEQSAIYPERRIRTRIFTHPDGVAFLFANITEEVSREHRLSLADAQTSAIDASALVGGLEVNLRGMIDAVGGGVGRFIGMPAERIVGLHLIDLVALPFRQHARDLLERALAGKMAMGTVQFLHGGEGEVAAEITIAPMKMGHGVEGAFVLVVRR